MVKQKFKVTLEFVGNPEMKEAIKKYLEIAIKREFLEINERVKIIKIQGDKKK
jgi:hypothetical protein